MLTMIIERSPACGYVGICRRLTYKLTEGSSVHEQASREVNQLRLRMAVILF